MKYIFSLFLVGSLFFSFAVTTNAQSTETAKSEYKATKEGWLVNLEKAYDLSKKTGKPILANFTGSDWCGWCKRLDRSVFHTSEFKKWAKEHVILLELDYPRRTKLPADIQKQNRNLQSAFKIRGYPTIWVFDLEKDNEGKFSIEAYGKTGYAKTSKIFTDSIDKMIANRKKK